MSTITAPIQRPKRAGGASIAPPPKRDSNDRASFSRIRGPGPRNQLVFISAVISVVFLAISSDFLQYVQEEPILTRGAMAVSDELVHTFNVPSSTTADDTSRASASTTTTTSVAAAAADTSNTNKDLRKVGFEGGAWTAQTHLSEYGFNADWGLMEVLEDACREIENRHNAPDSQWYQYERPGDHVLNGWWVSPKVVDAKVIEIGCGVGVYVDALKKEASKKRRQVFGIEPNPMGGTFERRNGPIQLAVNILEQGDTYEFATKIRKERLKGEYFDLIYSIEVFEHMPLERHQDAARFLAGLATDGTKLIFGASSPGQLGTGHIGNRKLSEWEQILQAVGFHKDAEATVKARRQMQEYNHKKNTQVYIFQSPK